jgi:hypothetical protein
MKCEHGVDAQNCLAGCWLLRPTLPEFGEVAIAWSECVPFFPKTELGVSLVADAISSFVASREQLYWFAREVVQRSAKYEGVPGLRAIFCMRYRPADGIEPAHDVAGASTEELEAQYARRVMEENEARIERYKREAALGAPEDRAPLEMPAVEEMLKPMPAPLHATETALDFEAEIAYVEKLEDKAGAQPLTLDASGTGPLEVSSEAMKVD